MPLSDGDRFEPTGRRRMVFWATLCAIAFGYRIWGTFHFPNAEQDGFSDAETIARFTDGIAHGTFRLSNLYGFWLPLFQFVAAVLNLGLRNALVSGQLVAGLCGAASCVLAAAVTHRLTSSLLWAGIVFLIVLLSPIHLLYSAACMTDVPFGCFLLGSLLFVFYDKWTAGMIMAAIAGGIRVEAWALIPLLPMLQFWKQRRVSVLGLIVLVAPPLVWLYISHLARGDWLAFFKDRVVYHEHYMDFYPSRRGFSFVDIRNDVDFLMFGANRVIFVAAFAAAIALPFVIARRAREWWRPFVAVCYVMTIFSFLILGYVTKRQPVWLPRYGLFALVLGAPLFAWLASLFWNSTGRRAYRRIAVVAAIALCAAEAHSQMSIIPKVCNDFRGHLAIAQAVASGLSTERDSARCFSDDVSVRVLSGLRPERFVQSHDVPAEAWQDKGIFDSFLRAQNVRYLVFMPTEDSLPAKWLSGDGGSPDKLEGFQRVVLAKSDFGPPVSLYRVTN